MELRPARVEEIDEWEAFASSHPEGRIFHSVKYFETLREWRNDYELLVARDDGLLVAGALVNSRALPWLGWRSANVEGGILMKHNSPELLEDLYLSLIRYLSGHAYVELRLHMRTPRQIEQTRIESSLLLDDALRRCGARREEVRAEERTTGTYLVDLQRDDDALLASLSRNCRRDVRKAAREGLIVEENADPSLLETFYEQHASLYRRKRLRVPLRGPFLRSAERALQLGLMRIYVARFAGTIVNMALVSRYGTPLFSKGASVAGVLQDRVPPSGQYLHYEIMRRLRNEGFRQYDLGGSPGLEPDERHPNYSVWRFKRGFGGAFHQDLGVYYAVLKRIRKSVVSLARGVHGRFASLWVAVES